LPQGDCAIDFDGFAMQAINHSSIEFRITYLQGKEVGLLPEGHDQGWSATHAAQRAAGMEA
jgi:hypothetical protein